MAYAQRGVGKTQFAIGLSYAVSTGDTFLRWHAPQARKVLYVDGEMPRDAMQERANALLATAGPRPPSLDHFRILCMDTQEIGVALNLARKEDQQRLEDHVRDAELLVLDNLSTLVNGGRENDAESWDAMQGRLLHLRRKEVSVLLIHHAGRGETARGTSKREDVLDTVFHLRRPDDYRMEEGARFEVHLTKARGVFGEDAIPFEARLEVRDGAALWTARELTDVEADRMAELTRDGMSVRDIAEETGLTRSKVNRIQKRLKAEDAL